MRGLVAFTVLGQLAYPAGWIVSGSLQRDYSAIDNYVSDLGVPQTTHPWIMNLGLVLFGLSFVTLGLAMRSATGWAVAPVWFAVIGAIFVAVGFLHEDCWTMTDRECFDRHNAGTLSWQHYAHGLLSIAAGLLIDLSPLVVALSLRRGILRSACMVCAAVGIAGVALSIVSLQADAPRGGQGLLERLYAGVVTGWVLLLVAAMLLARADVVRRRAERWGISA